MCPKKFCKCFKELVQCFKKLHNKTMDAETEEQYEVSYNDQYFEEQGKTSGFQVVKFLADMAMENSWKNSSKSNGTKVI